MILGGPLQGGSQWLPFYALAAVLLLGLVCSGGLVAWLVAKRWEAFLLGTCAFATVAWWLRVRFGLAGEATPLWGWLASALVGAAFRSVDSKTSPDSYSGRRLGAGLRALIGFVVVVACLGAVLSERSNQRTEKATGYTRRTAEQVARLLVESDANTANDLALAVVGPGTHVLQASGHRDREGAELVVRITRTEYGMKSLSRCWRYRLVNGPDDSVTTPVRCPDIESTVIPTDYGYNLASELLQMSPDSRNNVADVRRVVLDNVASSIVAEESSVLVERLDDQVIGIAVKAGVADCRITRLEPNDVNAPLETWQPDAALLRSDQIGCHPSLAAR